MRFIRNAVFACIAGMCLMCAPVHAETPSLKVSIPVTCTEEKEHTFTISSSDAPLPEKKTMTLRNETGSFVVNLSEPKNYHYTISDDAKHTYVADVFVTQSENGELSSELTATQDGKYKKNIVFEYNKTKDTPDEMPEPDQKDQEETVPDTPKPVQKTPKPDKKKKKASSVKTGDTTEIAKWCAGFGIAAVMAITLSKKVKRTH